MDLKVTTWCGEFGFWFFLPLQGNLEVIVVPHPRNPPATVNRPKFPWLHAPKAMAHSMTPVHSWLPEHATLSASGEEIAFSRAIKP